MITQFPLSRITDNPWNERGLDEANVDTIAASIQADGLLQPPLGRWLDGGAEPSVQLAFGHHRLAAYRKLQTEWNKTSHEDMTNPWDSISVDVRELDDITMAKYAIVENHHRSDPSAIERARALLRLTGELHMTQAEAGALFGLKSQASVAHLTALLRLPDDVQQLVHSGQIAQAAARALLPLLHFQPAAVSKIAKDSLEEEPDDRSEAILGEIRNLLERKAKSLATWGRPWPLEWPAKPLAIDDNRKEKGEPSTIPACRGCQFAVLKDPKADPQGRLSYCLREPCFNAKGRAWARMEVARASEKLGIPVAAPGETVSVVFSGSYDHAEQQRAGKLLRARLPELRLAPQKSSGVDHGLMDLFGSKDVMLVTTSNMAVTKYLNETKGKPVGTPAKSANETPAQAERRRVAEVEQREERALERIAFNRAKSDILWLVDHVAALIAERTVAGGGLLKFVDEHITDSSRFGITTEWGDVLERKHALGKAAATGLNKAGSYSDYTDSEIDLQYRHHLVYSVLGHELTGYEKATKVYGDVDRARKTCIEVAKDFGIELPTGWDQAPIHRTPINCWECGRFSAAAGGKLTQGDAKEGWKVMHTKGNLVVPSDTPGSELVAVFCPEHSVGQTVVNKIKEIQGEGQSTAKAVIPAIPEKQPTKRSPKSNAIAQQAAAQALALANRPNVHGHAHPAPKPSAKKTIRRKTAKKGK